MQLRPTNMPLRGSPEDMQAGVEGGARPVAGLASVPLPPVGIGSDVDALHNHQTLQVSGPFQSHAPGPEPELDYTQLLYDPAHALEYGAVADFGEYAEVAEGSGGPASTARPAGGEDGTGAAAGVAARSVSPEAGEPRKVAPRSKALFRVGPPFQPTAIHSPLFCADSGEQVRPHMSTRVDRGFELGEAGFWIGYKRNYITLVSTFVFQDWSMERFLRSRYYAVADGARVEIRSFALAVSVRCNWPDVRVGLVQHTPKRDKGPRFATPVYPAVPGGRLPAHEVVTGSCNKRNDFKLAAMKRVFGFDKDEFYAINGLDAATDGSILRNYAGPVITKVARFERIQFTASLRVKPPDEVQKYYILSVELLGVGEDAGANPRRVLLASSDSCPLLVRGRSPSKYHADKTSGYRGCHSESSAEPST